LLNQSQGLVCIKQTSPPDVVSGGFTAMLKKKREKEEQEHNKSPMNKFMPAKILNPN